MESSSSDGALRFLCPCDAENLSRNQSGGLLRPRLDILCRNAFHERRNTENLPCDDDSYTSEIRINSLIQYIKYKHIETEKQLNYKIVKH